MVQGFLRGGGTPAGLDASTSAHVRRCPACRTSAQQYERLAGELRALRDLPAADDPSLVEAIARRVDDEIGRRLRRTWAIGTVAGGLAVAGAAGVAGHLLRGRIVVAGGAA